MKKKKVIFINNHLQVNDGTVRSLVNLCNNLDPEKFDITVMPVYRCENVIMDQFKPNIKIKKAFGFYFQGFNRLVRFIPPAWLYHHFVGNSYDIEVAFQCETPTRIIAHAHRADKVQVCWMHGYNNYPQYYKNIDKVVCVAEDNTARCRSELPYEADVRCCHNLLNDTLILKMGAEPADCPKGEGPLLVVVGRLSPEKGYKRLVKILSDLKQEGFKFRLMIIGNGPEERTIRQTIDNLKMSDCVFMMGKQDNPHKFTSKADLYICSSFSESYQTASTEAAILGVPLLSTNVSGAQEMVDTCESGAVSDLTDESLKNELRKILQNPEVLTEWKKTLNQTRKRFGLEARKKALNDLFSELYDLSCQKQDM